MRKKRVSAEDVKIANETLLHGAETSIKCQNYAYKIMNSLPDTYVYVSKWIAILFGSHICLFSCGSITMSTINLFARKVSTTGMWQCRLRCNDYEIAKGADIRDERTQSGINIVLWC